MATDALVIDYLTRLEAASVDLPADRRADLIDEVRGHIDLALEESPTNGEPAVRQVLARLGSPEEIVAAEVGTDTPMTAAPTDAPAAGAPAPATTPADAAPAATPRFFTTERTALLLLSLGAILLPFAGPLLGMWVAWSSDRWTRTQKRVALASVLGFLFLPAVLIVPLLVAGELNAVRYDFGSILLLIPLSGLVTALYLVIVLRHDYEVVDRRRP